MSEKPTFVPMRGLFTFFIRYHFFFLFLLMELASASLVVKNNHYHRYSFLSSSNAIIASLMTIVSNVTDYINLKKTNQLLAEENAKLRATSILAFTKYQGEKWVIRDTIYDQKYIYLSAKVINNSVYKRNNYLTIDKGALNGIEPDMGVVASDGVVGIVKDVSDNFSTVISLLHKETKISAKVKKSGHFGSLTWDGMDITRAVLSYVPKHVNLQTGDTIETSGYSVIFAEGIMIGTIDEFTIPEGENSYTATVRLSTDFNKISHVYIIRNLLKQEQKILENIIE